MTAMAAEQRALFSRRRGLLLNAPNPLVSIVVDILHDAGVKLTVATGRQARWPRKVLIAGDNFVIATSFKLENRTA